MSEPSRDVTRLLYVDDEVQHAEAAADSLRVVDYAVDVAHSGEQALELLRGQPYDLLITDLVLGDMDGLSLMHEARTVHPFLGIIMITGHGSIESAVEAMRRGAVDYMEKPVDIKALRIRVRKALDDVALRRRTDELERRIDVKFGFEGIIGSSPNMHAVIERLTQIAPTDVSVLILGESGTGKELIAKAIHANSPRSDKPFVVVNSGSMPSDLLESNLFGHVKGAFTGAVASKKGLFEVADGGSIFFDEIGNIGLDVQAKLLRVIQEREFMRLGSVDTVKVDVRIIAATNADLKQQVAERTFREDLYYRINVITITLPPLREKIDDVPLLARYFLDKYGRENGREDLLISDEALKLLETHHWPGNVRELENAIERAVVLAPPSGEISVGLIRDYIEPEGFNLATPTMTVPPEGLPMKDVVQEFQKQLIVDALRKTSWVQKEAAKLLDVKPTTLNEMIKRYGLRQEQN